MVDRMMTRPWDDIVDFYREYQHIPPRAALKDLTENIAQSRLVEGLFAWTSMADLCIVQQEVSYPYDGPYLRVSPASEEELEFRYVDTRDTKKQRVRVVPAEAAWGRLLAFLKQLQWFPDLELQSQPRN